MLVFLLYLLMNACRMSSKCFNKMFTIYPSVAEFQNGVAEGKVDPVFNPIAAVRLTVMKDSAVWAIVSEVSQSYTSHHLLIIIIPSLHKTLFLYTHYGGTVARI